MSTFTPLGDVQILGLILVLVLVLILPLLFHFVEKNIEFFLLICGLTAVTIASEWSDNLVWGALKEPAPISITVLLFGLAFSYWQKSVSIAILAISRATAVRTFVLLSIIILGLISSIITAVISAFLLTVITKNMKLSRQEEVRYTVFSCFSIGLGAAITPLGEPLSAIVTSKMDEDFFYLFRLLGFYIIPLIAALGVVAAFAYDWKAPNPEQDLKPEAPTGLEVLWRAVKVYIFVCALLLLGAGLQKPAAECAKFLPAPFLFWGNMLSAVVDNATLAAAEITPSLDTKQITAALLGLLTSGGILIPGNIPNIIAANHLRIRSREWAKVGVPVGLVLMVCTFIFWAAVSHIPGS
jgi:predicted cation transporter